MRKVYSGIDECAENNSKQFWNLVNRKRSQKINIGCEIKFDNTVYRDPKSINQHWYEYFRDLFSPLDNYCFDNSLEVEVNTKLMRINNSIEHSISSTPYEPITIREVSLAIDKSSRNKSCGIDELYYEHFIYSGYTVRLLLVKLFDSMLRFSYTPTILKKGEITVLYKGNGKPRNDPKSYRAITLSSVLLKLYESVLLSRNDTKSNINELQGGFRKGFGCLMTSYLLHESINFAVENNSKLYLCFSDVQSAFDCVWYNSLMVKLYNMGVNPYIFLSIQNLYKNMSSCVKNNGLISDWFPVLQGSRQGGV